MAAFKLSRAGSAPAHVKILVHGKSGSGKSHIGATAGDPAKDGSDVAILLFEANGLPTIQQVNPNAIVAKAFAPEEHGCKTAFEVMSEFFKSAEHGVLAAAGVTVIVVDSGTEMMRCIKAQIQLETQQQDNESWVLTMAQWGELGERTLRAIRRFRDLPYDVTLIALSSEDKDEEVVNYAPMFDGKKVPEAIMQFFTAVGFAFKITRKVKDADGNEKDATFHYVRFEGASRWSVKPARPLADVEIMENVRFGTLIQKVRNYQHTVPGPTVAAPVVPVVAAPVVAAGGSAEAETATEGAAAGATTPSPVGTTPAAPVPAPAVTATTGRRRKE